MSSSQPNQPDKAAYDREVLKALETADSFDPIGQYFLDPTKHRRHKSSPQTSTSSSSRQNGSSCPSDDFDDFDDFSVEDLTELSFLDGCLVSLHLKTPYPHLSPAQRSRLREAQLRHKVRLLDYNQWPIWHPLTAFFLWVSPLAKLGRSHNLSLADIPTPPSRLMVDCTYPKLMAKWIPAIEKEQKRILGWYSARFKTNNPSLSSDNNAVNDSTSLVESYPNYVKNRFGTFDHFKSDYEAPTLQLAPILDDSLLSNHPAITVITNNPDVAISEFVMSKSFNIGEENHQDGTYSSLTTTNPNTKTDHKIENYPKIASLQSSHIARKESFPFMTPIMTKTFMVSVIFTWAMEILFVTATLSQPLIIKGLTYYLSRNEVTPQGTWDGLKWALILLINGLFSAAFLSLNNQGILDLQYRQMSAVLASVFDKTFSIAGWSLSDDPHLSTGTVMNMVSQDLDKVGNIPWYVFEGLTGPFVVIACLIMMYQDLGYAAIVAGLFALAMLPWQFYSSSLIAKYREELLVLTDERIRFVTQIFSGIRIIKAYSWEQALGNRIQELRKKELRLQMKVSGLSWFADIVSFVIPSFITVASIATYLYTTPKDQISPEKCLLIVPYLNIIKNPLQYLTEALSAMAEYHVSTSRIARLFGKEEWPVFERDVKELILIKEQRERNLLNKNTKNDTNDLYSLDALGSPSLFPAFPRISPNPLAPELNPNGNSQPQPVVQLNHVDFYWASFDTKPFQTPVLANVSLTINPGEIVAVVGPSAIGKTALLTGILGNLYPQPHKTHQGLPTINNVSSGELVPGQFSLRNSIEIIPEGLIYRHNECGYASQHPFLINNTIRNNIILSSEFDQTKFQLCIDAAALGPDLAVLPQGDLTIVSAESGLSGGQQARVAFCRLLYHAHCIKVAVLDDIFAAVDSFVAKTMFKKGVRGILKDCGIILALNSHYDFLHEATKTVYLGPSDDTFWPSLHLQLTDKRNQYEEWAASKRRELGEVIEEEAIDGDLDLRNQNSTPRQSTGYSRQFDTKDNDNDKTSSNVLKQLRQESEQYGQFDLRSPDPFRPLEITPQTQTASPSSPSDRRHNSSQDGGLNPLHTFRPPSCIQYIGDIQGLFQLDTPLIKAITLAQDKEENDQNDQKDQNDQNDQNGQNGTKKSQLWLEKLKQDEEDNAELSRQIGLVTDAATLKSIDKKLGQKIEGHGEKKTEPAPEVGYVVSDQFNQEDDDADFELSGSPTQAKIPSDLIFTYFQAHHTKMMGLCIVVAIILVAMGCQVFRSGIDIWILTWAEDVSEGIKHNKPQSHSNSFWIWTSIGALLMNVLFSAALLFLFVYISYSASVHLHNKTINSLFRSTLGYLDTTPMGTLINALTRDIFAVDADLPNKLILIAQLVFEMVATLVLILFTSPLLFLPLIPALLIIYWARIEYHNTTVQLRRIENATTQPVFTTFSSILKGSSVLRSFASHIGVAYIQKFRNFVNDYMRAAYVGSCIERRFSFTIDMVAALYSALLALAVVLLRDRVSTTLAMLSISYSLKFTSFLQYTVRIMTHAAQSMTSVHRLQLLQTTVPHEPSFDSDTIARKYVQERQPSEFKEFQNRQTEKHNIDQENGEPRYVLMEDNKTVIDLHYKYHEQQKLSYWPWFGKIVFEDVTLRYRPELPIVLNKCSFTIQPGQHWGLVAPTGAGKSTTLLALMRMINLDSGRILIDDVDITQIGLGDLRSHLGLIPQQSIIFSGTVRSNLDPLSRFTDDELWLALGLVAMVTKIQQMGGLYSSVLENGSNFSSSERQLLCIARSLLAQPTLGAAAAAVAQSNNTTPRQMDHISNHQPFSSISPKSVENSVVFDTKTETLEPVADPDPFSLKIDHGHLFTPYAPHSSSPSAPTNLSKLQQGSILLADEITSMVSGENDALVQATIRTAFARSTILVIAHRLASVVDLDRIIVLRRINQTMINQGLGSVLEFEVPWILLNDPDSQFYQMCMATGADNFVLLWCKARDAFFRTQKKELELYSNEIIQPVVDYDNLPPELVSYLKQEEHRTSTRTSTYSGPYLSP